MVWQTVIILVQAVIIGLACVGGILGWRKAWQLSIHCAGLGRLRELDQANLIKLQETIQLTEESNARLRAHIDNKPVTKPVKQSQTVARTAADVRRITEQVWGAKPDDYAKVQQ